MKLLISRERYCDYKTAVAELEEEANLHPFKKMELEKMKKEVAEYEAVHHKTAASD